MKYSVQRTVTDSPGPKRGLTFDDYMTYKKLCEEPKKNLGSDHMFYGFDLKSHNANAD